MEKLLLVTLLFVAFNAQADDLIFELDGKAVKAVPIQCEQDKISQLKAEKNQASNRAMRYLQEVEKYQAEIDALESSCVVPKDIKVFDKKKGSLKVKVDESIY